MRITTCEHFGIDPYDLRYAGAMNASLDGYESNVYIDPRLLRTSRVKEFHGAMDEVALYYADVLKDIEDLRGSIGAARKVLKARVLKKLQFHELRGLRIGYGKGGEGKAVGPKRAKTLYELANKLVRDELYADPVLFEVFTIVEAGVGADLISDMVACIIRERIYKFSRRIGEEFDLPMGEFVVDDRRYDVPWNPLRDEPLLFAPYDAIADIPAFGRSNRFDSFTYNHPALRDAFSAFLKKHTGATVRRFLRENPDYAKTVVAAYRETPPLESDHYAGPEGMKLAGKVVYSELKAKFRTPLRAPVSAAELHACVRDLCERFQEEVEAGRCRRALHANDGPRSEAAVQDMFRFMAAPFCQDRDIKLSPESNAGVGPADFQFDRGFNAVSIVEMKLSSNEELVAGYEHQAMRYKAANGAHSVFFYVVDLNDETERLRELVQFHDERAEDHDRPHLFIVDGRKTPSASKVRKAAEPLPAPKTQPMPRFAMHAMA